MHRSTTFLFPLALLVALGCGKDEGSSGEEPAGEAKAEPAAGVTKRKARKKRVKKDRGEAAMKLGDLEWTSSSASARLKGDKLTIKASNTKMDGKKVSRQEIHLRIDDYKGPGSYKSSAHGSRFIAVNLDRDKAAKGDKEATEAATNALAKSKHMLLSNAAIEIKSANDDEIVGTFSWEPPKGLKQPAIKDGTFRARIRKPKKK